MSSALTLYEVIKVCFLPFLSGGQKVHPAEPQRDREETTVREIGECKKKRTVSWIRIRPGSGTFWVTRILDLEKILPL